MIDKEQNWITSKRAKALFGNILVIEEVPEPLQFNDISNQQDAAKFVLIILLSLLYVFRATVSPIFRNTLTVYAAFRNNVLQWYNYN